MMPTDADAGAAADDDVDEIVAHNMSYTNTPPPLSLTLVVCWASMAVRPIEPEPGLWRTCMQGGHGLWCTCMQGGHGLWCTCMQGGHGLWCTCMQGGHGNMFTWLVFVGMKAMRCSNFTNTLMFPESALK